MEKQRIVFIGAGGVGKSAIRCVWCYADKLDDPTFDPTIEAIDQREIIVDGKKVVVEVIDSGFQFDPDMPNNTNINLIKEADGFVLIYSITDRESLNYITEKYKEILRIKDLDKCPMVLVSNKMDLENSVQQVILSDEGLSLAKRLGIPFIQTSAKKKPPMGLDDIFSVLVNECRKQQPQSPQQNRRTCIIA